MVLPDTEGTKLCSPLAKQKICSKFPVPGALQQHLFYGEYSPFKYAPIFESDFVQVTKKGEVLSIHKDITVVTVGVTSTSPSFSLPNVMLLARPIDSLKEMVCNCRISTDRCPMELTRLFPLCFVNISIHDVYNRQLRLKLANGRAFYLQLYVHPDCENEVFERWMKLVTLLHNNPENVYGYEAITPEIECILEQTSVETLATELSDWQLEEPAMSPAMREYYETNRPGSGKSDKSRKSRKSEMSEKPEDCSTRTRSRSRKSDSGKAEEAESTPDFSQEQEPWPPIEPPKRKKKTRGPMGFNFFKKDKGSKEKSPEEDQMLAPVTTPTEDHEEELKMESEQKDDRKKSDEGKDRQKKKSKDKEGKERKQGDKDKKKEKMEKQKEREQQLKEKEEKRQQEKDKKKEREDKGGTEKGRRQQEREERRRKREERQREKEERRREKKAKRRGEEEKKQREKEETKPDRGKGEEVAAEGQNKASKDQKG
ncbi:golgin subfamily A member 6-like protein 22 [Mobula hypostoma]|uniref:golgin subfamily A member 6-like protein 22 n=1 Tax=Mobula hypostoma TaxID=723540 RepID=UPI002FC3BF8C